MGSRAISQRLIELGERIRKRRQELHLSQEKLAERADISLNTVSRVEGGQSDMSIEVFRRLAQSLGMSANELLAEVECTEEEEGKYKSLVYRIRNLNQTDQEIVLQTVNTLVDTLYRYHDCAISHDTVG